MRRAKVNPTTCLAPQPALGLAVRLPHIWIFHFKHTSLEMRRQSVRFQYFLVLEQTAKATKTRTERASASCDDDDWASMRRVRARRRAICTCWCALVCVLVCACLGHMGVPWHATWPCMWAMAWACACASACNLPNARCAGVCPLHLPLSLMPQSHILHLGSTPRANFCASSSLWYCCRCWRCFFNKCGCWPIPAVNHKSALMMYFMVLCFGIISHIFGFCCTFLSSVQQPQTCVPVSLCVCVWARYFIIIKHQEQHEPKQQRKKQQRQLDQLRPGKCLQLSLADDMQSFCHVARNWQWSCCWCWSCLHPFVLYLPECMPRNFALHALHNGITTAQQLQQQQ